MNATGLRIGYLRKPIAIAFAIAAFKIVLYAVAGSNYGYFRDELYFLACADHLAWGYPDHAPLSVFLTWASRGVFGDSLYAIHLLPTLAGAGLFFVALSRQTRDLREFEGSKWGTTLPYALPEVTQGLVRHIYDRMPASGTLLSWRFDRREEALYAGFLAETEATLDAEEVASNLAEALAIAWNTPSSRSLLKLDGLGMALGLAGCGFAWLATDDAGFGDAALALAFAVASLACLSAAHKLWKRADFVSLVYEVDIEAVYLEHVRPHGQIHVGGLGRRKDSQLMSGNVRVRVLRMRSVQFEPGGQRHVTGLALDIGESTRLATAVDDYHAHVLCDQAPGMPQDTLLQA